MFNTSTREPLHTWTLLIVNCRTVCKSSVWLPAVLIGIKNALVKSLRFQLRLNTLCGLNGQHNYKYKGLNSEEICGLQFEDRLCMLTLYWGYLTLYWGYLIVLRLFYLVCILYCGCFNLFCDVWVCLCVYTWVSYYVGVLERCVLVLTVFCIVCTVITVQCMFLSNTTNFIWWLRCIYITTKGTTTSDVWLTVHRNSVWIRKTN